MPSLTQIKILPNKAEDIYNLIMDIEKYPEFLPWCKQARINKISSKNKLEADLLIKFKGLLEKYTSDVNHEKKDNEYFIDVVATKGPFKKLINKWQIKDLNDGNCEVKFFIDFEFNSFILQKMIGVFFQKATNKMMNAFEERAKNFHD